MSIAELLASGRRAAEALMFDVVEIRGPDVVGAMVNGKRPITPGPLKYRDRAKLQSYEAYSAQAMSGAHMYTTQQHRVDIPVGAAVVEVEDVVTVVECPEFPAAVGKRSTIAGVPTKALQTAQRLQCTRIAA